MSALADTDQTIEQPADGIGGTAPDAEAAVEWRRLSIRVVYVDLLRVLIALVPGYLGTVVFNDDGPVWPLVVGSALGVLSALLDFRRWVTTRYRITPTQVELNSGWVARKRRVVPRDRIRSVDVTAKARHRLFRLRVVHVGSGESDSSFNLDAVDSRDAELLQDELMTSARRRPGTTAKPAHAAGPDELVSPDELEQTRDETPEPEVVIARLRWQWLPLNVVNIWAAAVVAGPIFGLYWFLRPFGIDLLDFAAGLLEWQALGPVRSVLLCVAVAFPFGVLGLAGAFLLENWNFVLLRVGTPPASALVTRRGLLNTQTVQRDDQRLRGLSFKEPLIWRWLRLAETKVLTTGLRKSGEQSTGILPRIKLSEARELAAAVLLDDHRPMEATLLRHPRGALLRRLYLAAYGPALMAGILVLFVLSGALPAWVWPLPFTLLPLTLALAVAAYLALGHALTGPYLVVRRGAVNRNTVALQTRAVIGWTFQQSLLQQWGNRMTVGIATAAGDRYYPVPDAGVDQALAFVRGATPELAVHLLEVATVRKEPDGESGAAAQHN
ncbi:PH domain-containing protein [Micromonospora sp. NPDC005324]|uniref:PH domain-containing protein n=1 Tax=Micromonospora sp. NPDC005324 TaxID=3157033 RepID=UPI0033A6ABC8